MTGPVLLEGLPVWVNDANHAWQTLRIARSIPLSRLEWLWVSRGASLKDTSTSARAVFEVSCDATEIPEPTSEAFAWFSNPYVYALVTTLSELSSQKEDSFARIRRFVGDCKRNSYEYMIILAANDDECTEYRRVVDKLKGELNATARGRERLVVVPPASIREEQRPITHLHHSPAHQDLLIRLRECIREGAEARVQAYENEVSRSYLNRSSASWSFMKFFALKEGMAFVFVQLGRRDIAVRFYDELQATMTEREELGRGTFCDQQAADAALGVSNPEAKDYRSLLLEHTITEIDMRTYLFARQISLMLIDRKYSEVAERGLKFITTLARRCAEESVDEGKSVSGVFRDTWVFCTARALAAVLTPAIPSPSEADAALSVQLSTSKERHTARLIAGFHVHAMKAFMGLAHVTLPGCLAPDDPEDVRDKSSFAAEARATSNERLRNALATPKNAEVLHSEIANAAASLYEMGGRARGAAALDGDAGVVRIRNGSFSEAETLLSAQCSRYINDNGWDELHKRQRLQLSRAEKELDRVQEYLISCLTMLYMSRRSRKVWMRNALADAEEDARRTKEDAAYWASEAALASMRLPRIMKYKADRLFQISVKPNDRPWLEGNPGTATVTIKSDIPTTLAVESVVVECLHPETATSVRARPALQHREEAGMITTFSESSAAAGSRSENTNSLTSYTSSSANTELGEEPGVVIFQSATPVAVKTGRNDILVRVGEIPYAGRYNVSVVALFLGNLKLIQTAGKIPTKPVVTVKGPGSGRLLSPSKSSSFPDVNKGDLRFPLFFSSPRDPSASMKIGENSLYLAPDTTQFVRFEITAGQFGIAKGASIACTLLSSSRTPFAAASKFVSFVDASSLRHYEQDSGPVILSFKGDNTSSDNYSIFATEITLREDLGAGETLSARVALRLYPDCLHFRDRHADTDTDRKTCLLRLHLSCQEKDSACSRKFVCVAEKKLLFSPPLDVSARIELSANWGEGDVSRDVGLDGTHLGDGGTLICAVRRKTSLNHPVTIKNAELATPSWLQMRPDETPVHVELLPYSLDHGSLFTFSFDVLTRDEPVEEPYYDIEHEGTHNTLFEKNTPERRLSRAIANSSRMDESQDDISPLSVEKRYGSRLNKANTTTGASWQHRPVVEGASVDTSEVISRRYTSEQDKEEHSTVGNSEAMEVNETLTDVPRETAAGDQDESSLSKEAEEVVDLSARGDEGLQMLGGFDSPPPTPMNNDEIALFRVEVCIEGMEFPLSTSIERKICMSAFRKEQRRYRIERTITKAGEAGKLMELQFAVRVTSSEGSDHQSPTGEYPETAEAGSLQYEVDADPTIWLVVGRRRGKLNMIEGLTAVGTARVVPIVCGRQRVPSIRLFTADGRGLALSRYDNVNEYMQVVITPCRTVVSSCSARHALIVDDTELSSEQGGRTLGKNKMPEVIASDSFFGS